MVSGEFRGTDRFLVQRRLGAGGFGVVYEALDRDRNAVVALKTIRNVTPRALYRFKREFRALADISHPNLVQLYELVSFDGEWFFTMERIEGKDFLEFVWNQETAPIAGSARFDGLAEGGTTEPFGARLRMSEHGAAPAEPEQIATDVWTPADLPRLMRSMTQLVEGVAALHRADSIHRDIKPSNVMIAHDGRVVLLDFGLIADMAAETIDQSTEVFGTPAYMSPEQAAGLSLSPASDWYSVGVLLFQSLTGQLPVTGSALEIIRLKQDYQPVVPSRFVAGVPAPLDTLCRDLLSRDPAGRPGVDEILVRLGNLASTAPNPLVIPSRSSTITPFVGRGRPLAKLGAAFGPSGIGKTSLIRAFLQTVRDTQPDAVVLLGRCYERESVPYKGLDSLIDSLARHLRRLPAPAVDALLPRHAGALSQLFPVLRQFEHQLAMRRRVSSVPDLQELRRRGFGALRELLIRLADSAPLILVIDDLQWGDGDSAELLKEVLRAPDAPSLLFVASYRSDETKTSPFLRAFLTPQTQAELHMSELRIDQLSPDESRELAGALLRGTAPRLM
jgi:serine/threonine protein kinase